MVRFGCIQSLHVLLLVVVAPSPAWGRRGLPSMRSDAITSNAREVLHVEVDGQSVRLAGHEVCSTGCTGRVDGESHPKELTDACDLYTKCMQLVQEKHGIFPNFDEEFCDDTIEQFGIQACHRGQLGNDGLDGSLVSSGLSEVLKIVQESRADGFSVAREREGWSKCDLPTDASCAQCLHANHRGGITKYSATSYGCAWHEGSCVAAHRGEPLISDQASCGVGSVFEADELDGEGQGSSFSELDAAGGSHGNTTSTGGGKKALLIAYAYPGSKQELDGTVPDVVRVFQHLTRDRGFDPRDITVLFDHANGKFTDDNRRSPTFKRTLSFSRYFQGANQIVARGTKTEFIGALQDAKARLQAGDFFVFHYSGHGSYVRDSNGDELDGLDEIVMMPNGEYVIDDAFYDDFLATLPSGVTVSAITDACHSEGFSDLPFNYMSRERTWCTDWTGTTTGRTPRSLPLATITYISGSQNHQTSTDLGDAGALSMHAITHWKGRLPFYRAMQGIESHFKREEITQLPNLAAWPTFRDTALFSPWDPANADPRSGLLVRDPARGGPAPDGDYSNTRAIMPELCGHGAKSADGRDHGRQESKMSDAKRQMTFSPALTHADKPLPRSAPREGWVDDDSARPPAAARPASRPLPEGWDQAQNEQGRTYYFNIDTGVSQWAFPTSPAKRPPVPQPALAPTPAPSTNRPTISHGNYQVNYSSKLGIGFDLSEGDWQTVVKVTPGGAAENAGIQVGDQLWVLNGVDMRNLSLEKRTTEVLVNMYGTERFSLYMKRP